MAIALVRNVRVIGTLTALGTKCITVAFTTPLVVILFVAIAIDTRAISLVLAGSESIPMHVMVAGDDARVVLRGYIVHCR